MSQSRKNPVAFTATEALEAYRRVKLTSGSGTAVEYADAGEAAIGVTVSPAAIGEMVLVSLIKAGETHKVTCSAGVVVGASLYGTNDGKVDDAGTGAVIGTALEAGSANNSVIEAILDQDSAQGLAHIADVAAVTQDALTDSTGGVAGTTLAAATNMDALTDNSGGTADTTIAEITNAANAGSADVGPVKNAIADIAAQLTKQVALNTVLINAVASLAAQLTKVRADNAAQVTKINAILARLEAAGINAAS